MYPNFALLLILNAYHEVLLLRRINTPFCNGCYSLPGGEIKRGETARQTLVREVRASLKLTIDPEKLVFVHAMHRKCNEPEFIALVFELQNTSFTEIINGEPERHDLLGWYSLDALPDPMVPAHRQALECVRQGLMYSEHGWAKEVIPHSRLHGESAALSR